MGLYSIEDGSLKPVDPCRFADDDIRERDDLQRMLCESIEIVAPGVMVLAEEYSDWEDSRRRIDLLGLDDDGNLVVIELKRTKSGGHMDLQSIRYAAMVASMTFDRAVAAHERYLASTHGSNSDDAEQAILDFLGWETVEEEQFARDVRIILVSADFSTEITTAVLWLIERGIDIRCVKMDPHKLGDTTIVSVEQVIPLPSAQAYQVRLREKSIGVRESLGSGGGGGAFTGYWFVNIGEHGGPKNHRSWDDARRYGFIAAGGKSVQQITQLRPGDRVFAYRKRFGYVGAGVVTASATPWEAFVPEGEDKPLPDHALEMPHHLTGGDPSRGEHCLGIRWLKTLDREHAIEADYRRPTACRIRDRALVDELLAGFGLTEADFALE